MAGSLWNVFTTPGTEEEKNFGIQLDSLVDVVSFIALPIVFVVKFSGVSWYAMAASVMYSVFGVARLAYFNVCQEENEDKDSPIKYYVGMPVTYAALIFPAIYLLHVFLADKVIALLMCIVMEIMGLLFILHKRTKTINCYEQESNEDALAQVLNLPAWPQPA